MVVCNFGEPFYVSSTLPVQLSLDPTDGEMDISGVVVCSRSVRSVIPFRFTPNVCKAGSCVHDPSDSPAASTAEIQRVLVHAGTAFPKTPGSGERQTF